MSYTAPLSDITYLLRYGLNAAYTRTDPELMHAVLEAAGQLATDVLAPLNRAGDTMAATLGADGVTTTPGFGDAYQALAHGGWVGLSADPAHGGQGLPRSIDVAVYEMIQAANMAFGLCPVLSQGAIEALSAHGTPRQQAVYLPHLTSGRWTGTMNLTEPQAGSDVGAATARAVPAADGAYRLFGQKIYITWGDHDVAENIIHLVLARLPDAPAGARGLSLFLAPKFMVDDAGQLRERNDLRAVGLEHKLGIHGSPTCVMQFGETEGAWAELVGAPHGGMAAMFTMMNAARLHVGAQGVGIADRARQHALAYAHERKQGKAVWSDSTPSAIFDHPDVRRTLAVSEAQIMAARAICLACADAADQAHATGEARHKRREDILVPLAKAFGTDTGVEVASSALQVFGGMGYIEETGAAQFYRDARIAPIYEGTNAIQANDLIGRKLAMADGAAIHELLAEMDAVITAAPTPFAAAATALRAAHTALTSASAWMRTQASNDAALCGAVRYLRALSEAVGGMYLLRAATQAATDPAADAVTVARQRTLLQVYTTHILPLTRVQAQMAMGGTTGVADYTG